MSGRPEPLRGILAALRNAAPQRSLLEPPVAGTRSDRVVAMQDFLNRFQREMARQNIRRGDPLAPLLGLMGEMLLHFTHLAEDQTGTLESLVARLNTGTDQVGRQVQGLLVAGVQSMLIDMQVARQDFARDLETLQRGMQDQSARTENAVREIGRERLLVHQHVGDEAAALLTRAARQYGLWRSRVEAATLAVVFLAAVAGVWFAGENRGFDNGYGQGRTHGMASVVLEQRQFRDALAHDDDPGAAERWLQLMRWNEIGQIPAGCAPQRSAAGGPPRLACTYTFWGGPPDMSPPALSPGDPARSTTAGTENHSRPRTTGPGVVEFR